MNFRGIHNTSCAIHSISFRCVKRHSVYIALLCEREKRKISESFFFYHRGIRFAKVFTVQWWNCQTAYWSKKRTVLTKKSLKCISFENIRKMWNCACTLWYAVSNKTHIEKKRATVAAAFRYYSVSFFAMTWHFLRYSFDLIQVICTIEIEPGTTKIIISYINGG